MSVVDTDLRDLIAATLEENRLKAPRVQANLVLQVLRGRRPVLSEAVAEPEAQPEPPRWSKYADRNAKWLEDGIATTRNRTDAAITALGLDLDEIRAVVIERHTVHVFRWTDASERVGVGLPIIEEECA